MRATSAPGVPIPRLPGPILERTDAPSGATPPATERCGRCPNVGPEDKLRPQGSPRSPRSCSGLCLPAEPRHHRIGLRSRSRFRRRGSGERVQPRSRELRAPSNGSDENRKLRRATAEASHGGRMHVRNLTRVRLSLVEWLPGITARATADCWASIHSGTGAESRARVFRSPRVPNSPTMNSTRYRQ